MENKLSFYLACATCKHLITAASVWRDTSDGWVTTIGSAISDHMETEVQAHVMNSLFGGESNTPHLGLQLFDMDWQPISNVVTLGDILLMRRAMPDPTQLWNDLGKMQDEADYLNKHRRI